MSGHMSDVVHILRPRAAGGPHVRVRRMETPAARHQRRLRHLARMSQWYAIQRRGGKGDEHVTD